MRRASQTQDTIPAPEVAALVHGRSPAQAQVASPRQRLLAAARRWVDTETRVETAVAESALDRVDWLRAAPFVAMHLACAAVLWLGVSATALWAALGLYAIRMFALTGFYHRYFSHRTFRTSRAMQFVFALIGASCAQRGPLWWAAHHRNHHRHADTKLDPHSPSAHGKRMRIAVVGSGIAGLASAWLLSRAHEVHLFEANDYLGGHTHTHDIQLYGQRYRVDTGFIVYNPHHYPLLTRLFFELGVATQPTLMSFSVRNEASGLEYNATSLDTLFCQRRNLFSPRFLGMIADLVRFYREAPALLEGQETGPALGDYLAEHRYGHAFRDEHLVPMASALWSSPAARILSFPARYLVQFMANHQMLQLTGRPQWRVVKGGSASYVRALRARWKVRERLSCTVRAVRRAAKGVAIETEAGQERFDQIVLACHSDQALALLVDASEREQAILGAIPYQENDTVLHTDARLLPARRKAWAAWNAYVPREPSEACTVSYCMNVLQGIQSPEPLVVTLNRSAAIDPHKVLRRMRYQHPVYSHASVAAQARKAEIQGVRCTWFAGAYWGFGFHEDGMRSALDVARALDVGWCADACGEAARERAPEALGRELPA